MDKFTDNYFGFPVKVHEKISSGRDENKWVAGIARVPGQWFIDDKVSWYEDMDSNRGVEDFEDKGLDELTVIIDSENCHYQCLWDRKKFEDKLNDFMGRRMNVEVELEEGKVKE